MAFRPQGTRLVHSASSSEDSARGAPPAGGLRRREGDRGPPSAPASSLPCPLQAGHPARGPPGSGPLPQEALGSCSPGETSPLLWPNCQPRLIHSVSSTSKALGPGLGPKSVRACSVWSSECPLSVQVISHRVPIGVLECKGKGFINEILIVTWLVLTL